MRETSVGNKIVIAERDNIAAVMENGKVSEFFVHRGEILLGDISEYKEKLDILKRWYEQHPERNCDTLYSRINLKYDNLIYCTRKN